MSTLHALLPGDIDDPAHPSGGNGYDRRLLDGLSGLGWRVVEHPVPGRWPLSGHPLRPVLDRVPDGSPVLVDGLLVVGGAADLVAAAARLRLVVLVHQPQGQPVLGLGEAARAAEHTVLGAAAAVVATSGWSAGWLASAHDLSDVVVATPGADPGPLAPGTPGGGALVTVGAVTPVKGHDLLVEALSRVECADGTVCQLPEHSTGWRWTCVGALDLDPPFVDRLRDVPLAGEVEWAGVRTDLRATWAGADLLVLPSRSETYGMAVTEALAHGVPVLATEVGGVAEALGRAPDGRVPGMLVAPEDAEELAAAVRNWLADPDLRARLREAALARRGTLPGWDDTVRAVAGVLAEKPAGVRA